LIIFAFNKPVSKVTENPASALLSNLPPNLLHRVPIDLDSRHLLVEANPGRHRRQAVIADQELAQPFEVEYKSDGELTHLVVREVECLQVLEFSATEFTHAGHFVDAHV